ncbi:MAG: phage major capsid protein [Anaeromyxobacteraceae bacterium]|nr:phage major capsid protein [Anaeromyxobacteraceae bacterium]
MAYNDLTSRSNASALIPEDVTSQIFQDLPRKSQVLALATKLPNMTRGQQRMAVLQSLPTAFFRNPTDTGLAQTTKMAWQNKYIEAEEIVVIAPIPKTVLEDSDYDIWGEAKPRIIEAAGKLFDSAVVLGTSAPSSWPTNIKAAAVAAGQSIALTSFADLYDACLAEGGLCDLVEQDGFTVTGHYAVPGMKAKFRGLRDANGQPIFAMAAQGQSHVGNGGMEMGATHMLDGCPCTFADNGAVTSSDLLLLTGDWRQLVYAIRRDIEWERLTEASIYDGAGQLVYALAQQGMIGLMVTFRLGWQVPNPPNQVNTNAATRYPFAVLSQA